MSSNIEQYTNVPAAVMKQLEAAEQARAEAEGQAVPADTQGTEPVQAMPTADGVTETAESRVITDDGKPGEEATLEPIHDGPLSETTDSSVREGSYEQKYKTLKGKYDHEVPKLQKENEQLRGIVADYADEIQRLQASSKEPPQQRTAENNANFNVSHETMAQLARAGYDSSDVEALMSIVSPLISQELDGLKQQVSQLSNSNIAGSFESAVDAALRGMGAAGYAEVTRQPSFHYASRNYSERGISLGELLEDMRSRNNPQAAAELLADAQALMIREGAWSGVIPAGFQQVQPGQEAQVPASIPSQSHLSQQPIPQPARPVAPHKKQTVASAPEVLPADYLKAASEAFRKGRISYEEFQKRNKSYNRAMQNGRISNS
jgi:hypothetical protein